MVDDETIAVEKSRVTKQVAPRLPDYLSKRKDAEQLRALFASENSPLLRKEMLAIAQKCQDKQFNLEYLHDWLAINQFLSTPELVNPYLDKLEQALQKQVNKIGKRRKFAVTDDDKWSLPESTRNPYARHKILSKYLYDWAAEHGFQQKAKFISLLNGETFLSMLRAKTLFKDSSVTANIHHGAWSHALQWYCIVEHYLETSFLTHEPLDVLQSYGDATQLNTSRSLFLAWDFTLDKSGDYFFTSPTDITRYLTDPEHHDRWPLLTESVTRQEEKSSHKFGSYRGYTTHLAEKHIDKNGDSIKIIIKKF